MIESFKDLKLEDMKKEEDVNNVFKEKLDLPLETIKSQLSIALKAKADSIVDDLISIIPHGNYSKVIEDPEKIAVFLKEEAAKDENWHLYSAFEDTTKNLLEMVFLNKSVDAGETLKGYAFVSKSGKIRHAFAQIEN